MAGFDWVKARSECSLQRIFATLAEIMDSDVNAANELKRNGVSFFLDTQAIGKIVVTRDRDMGMMKHDVTSMVFTMTQFSITVTARTSDGGPHDIVSVIPRLDENGECLLTIQDQQQIPPLKLWQVSRHFLEDLFFNF